MRLWTVHPRYLDSKGLVAAWREALLAQKVLLGGTKGYRHHPQLIRFQEQKNPAAALASFLIGLAEEAQNRDYHFDVMKISRPLFRGQIAETRGQLLYEWNHLRAKLKVRAPELARKFQTVAEPQPHPLFRIVSGEIKSWEKR
jgi:Pyrimidine dimer DNA glycosylase